MACNEKGECDREHARDDDKRAKTTTETKADEECTIKRPNVMYGTEMSECFPTFRLDKKSLAC